MCLRELVELHQDSTLEGDEKKQAILTQTIQLSSMSVSSHLLSVDETTPIAFQDTCRIL